MPAALRYLRGRATSNFFISYRREDSAAYAGRISDHLTPLFGPHHVFMDVEDISPGENFAQAIDQTIAACSAVLVIIGPRWMEILRKRSEEHQPDYVCHEIESALTRKALVIPVLVGGAGIAQLAGLPPNLAELPLHQAIEIRDTTFKEDCVRLANALGPPNSVNTPPSDGSVARRKLALWIGGSAAVVALLFALSPWASVGPWSKYRQRKARVEQTLNTARVQTEQGEYESAFLTYQDALKIDPAERTLMDRQVDAAMLWAENFHVLAAEGQKSEVLASPRLRQILSTLEAGLAHTNGQGTRAADILAHLGWAHWLNQKIAYQEFGSVAEQGMRKALSLEPSNVYANAMLGNWLLQTGGSVTEAMRCFDVAEKSGKQRPLVRSMQLGAMTYNDSPGVRTQLIRVANQMRINSEPLNDFLKRRILSDYSPTHDEQELRETLSAVPPDQAWATFQWLDEKEKGGSQQWQRDFIHATILEIGGNQTEALALFKTLQQKLKADGYRGRLADHVEAATKRLSRPHA